MATTAKRESSPEPKQLSRRSLERARPIAARYRIVIWREYGEWWGQGVEESGAMGDGRTIEQCVRHTRQALTAIVASHIVDREPIVTPIVDQDRRRRKAG